MKIKTNASSEKEESILPEIFYNLVTKKTGEIEKIHNSATKCPNLVYAFKGPTKNIDLDDFIVAENLFGDLKSKKIKFEDT